MSRLVKWPIFLLGLAVMIISICSLVMRGDAAHAFTLRLIAQGILVVEFLLVAVSMFSQKRTQKNAIVVLLLALVFAGVTIGTYISHHS
ncbi:MAG: hypothetical protein ACXVC1_09740 [Tumebacillaceae bacterium]